MNKSAGVPKTLYSVYTNDDGQCVVAYATAAECAKAMGITLSSFYSAATRCKPGAKNHVNKWHIERYSRKQLESELQDDDYDDIEEQEV